MNREILFQGFQEGDGDATIYVEGKKVKGRWVEGFYREQPAPLQCIGTQESPKAYLIFKHPNTLSDWGMPIQMCECEVIPATIGEYTNLTDKNGSRIFENCNIYVSSEDYTFAVRFGKCGGVRNCNHFGYEGFYLEPADDKTREYSKHGALRNDLHYWISENDGEVIGTVFDAVGCN